MSILPLSDPPLYLEFAFDVCGRQVDLLSCHDISELAGNSFPLKEKHATLRFWQGRIIGRLPQP